MENSSLNEKITSLSNNFQELVSTIVSMQKDFGQRINKIEMKQLTTINNLKVIKELLRDLQKKQLM